MAEPLNSDLALREKYADSKFSLAKWPLECWLEELVDIPMEKEFANRISAVYQGDILTKDFQSEVDGQIVFNHLLYLAEVLRNQSPVVTIEMLDLRNRMKDINGDAFKRYMEKIV